jgi:hypothetical protein
MTYEASDNTPSLSIWWKTAIVLGSLIIAPVFLPILLVVMPVFLVRLGYAEHKFRKRLRCAGRILDWRELRHRLDTGHGTMILEPYYDDRGWWISVDLQAQHPECPLPTAKDLRERSVERELIEETWCAQHFPSFSTTTCLVERPLRGWDWLRRKLPEERVRFASARSLAHLVLGDKELWINRPPGD